MTPLAGLITGSKLKGYFFKGDVNVGLVFRFRAGQLNSLMYFRNKHKDKTCANDDIFFLKDEINYIFEILKDCFRGCIEFVNSSESHSRVGSAVSFSTIFAFLPQSVDPGSNPVLITFHPI